MRYWSRQVEAEQLRAENVPAVRALLQRYGYKVISADGTAGTYVMYEQRAGGRVVRGFVYPGEWVHVSEVGKQGETYVRTKPGPPDGPEVQR